jgi:hypothetical protein
LVIFVVGEFTLTMVAVVGPTTCVQVPVPVVGAVAVMATEPGLTQAVLSAPALAVDGVAAKLISTLSCDELGQGVVTAIVHRKV